MSDQPIQDYEKPLKKAKQVNLIRKTTIQTLQPVIEKMEQHIAYLLQESTKLRQKNQLLEKTVADHTVLAGKIRGHNQEIHQMKLSSDSINSQQNNENENTRKQISNLLVSVQEIDIDLKKKENKINDLYDRNTEQKNKIDATKDQFTQIVQKYAEKVEQLEAENRRLSTQIKSNNQINISRIESLAQKIANKQMEYSETDRKIELYLNEREQFRQMIESVYEKVEKTVDIERYEHDWRIIRMENEDMKKNNRRMIDEALTPQVRAFLPQMMQRMEQIRKVNTLEKLFYQQKQKSDSRENQLQQQINKLQQNLAQTEQMIKQLNEQRSQEIKTKIDEIKLQISTQGNQQTDVITNLEVQTKDLIAQTKNMLLAKQENILTEIKQLVENRKQQIYQVVYELIPKEEKDFYAKMKQFLPLLEKTKVQIMNRCDNITEFGQNLQSQLDDFHNKVVKMKSDVGINMDNLNKKNKTFENNFDKINKNFIEMGKIVAIHTENLMLMHSINIQTVESEVYVTYSDGIIYEHNPNSQNEEQIFYRKVKATREHFNRSALSTIIKLTDQLMTLDEYSFLKINKNRPSLYFKQVKQGLIFTAQNRKGENTHRRQNSRQKKSHQNKLPSLDLNSSKTIDVTGGQDMYHGELLSQTLAGTDFKNSIVKKSGRNYKGRYSHMN